jgi:hypothetical protein
MFFALPISSVGAPQFEWSRQLGTSTYEAGNAVSTDNAGNVYLAGQTMGRIAGLDPGGSDPFLAKYDALGNRTWVKQLGTSATYDTAWAVSADGLGGIYIAGSQQVNVPGASTDALVAKYDAAGTLLWSRSLATPQYEDAAGISADGLGNVYVTGYTAGALDGGSAGGNDVFLAKYGAAGNLQWTRQLGSAGGDVGESVSADQLGNIYLTGWTTGSLGASSGGADVFIAKYDSSGDLQWVRQIGTPGRESAYGISADGLGGAYLTGYTDGNLDGKSLGGWDAFLAKYDEAGNLHWIRQFGTSNDDQGDGLAVDKSGHVYISGYTTPLGYTGPTLASFSASYDSAGNFRWMKQNNSADTFTGISTDGAYHVYVSGTTSGYDALVAKYSDQTGDFNADGRVDAADYTIWRKGLASGKYLPADYNTWRANFGVTAAAAGAAAQSSARLIPEPSSAIVLLGGLMLLDVAGGAHQFRKRGLRRNSNFLLDPRGSTRRAVAADPGWADEIRRT